MNAPNVNTLKQRVKVGFYIAQYPVRWPCSTRFRATLFLPGRPVHSDTNSASLGSIFYSSNNCTTTIFTHICPPVYSQVLIYTAEATESSWSERKCPNFETVAKGIRTRALSIASPAFYHWATALHVGWTDTGGNSEHLEMLKGKGISACARMANQMPLNKNGITVIGKVVQSSCNSIMHIRSICDV